MSDNNREPVFYYNRERRLQRASQTVKDAYQQKKQRGLMRLFGNRGNIMIFICIVLIVAMFSLGRYIIIRNEGIRLGGNIINLSLVHEEEVLLLAIDKRAPQKGEVYIGEVDILVRAAGNTEESAEEFAHRVIFNLIDTETFIIALPFTGNDFFVVLITNYEQKAIRVQL